MEATGVTRGERGREQKQNIPRMRQGQLQQCTQASPCPTSRGRNMRGNMPGNMGVRAETKGQGFYPQLAKAHNASHLGGIAKGIRQPENIAALAERVLKEALA